MSDPSAYHPAGLSGVRCVVTGATSGLTGTRIVANELDRRLAEFRSGRTG